MILSEVTFIRKNKNLEQMLQDVTSIYNKTLYYLRQAYFEGLKSGEQIKLPSAKELYNLVTESDERKGKRIRRGLFKSSIGKVLNADINGAIGIMRKVYAISDAQIMGLRDRGDVVSPLHLEIK